MPTVRPGHYDDLLAAAELCRASLGDAYQAILAPEVLAPWVAAGGFTDRFLADHVEHLLVAEHDHDLVGVCVSAEDRVDLLVVREECRGAGVGRQLIEAAERRMHAEGHAAATLACHAGNGLAVAFARRMGYAPVRRFRDPDGGGEKVELRKGLAAARRAGYRTALRSPTG
jgi:GNAT superfamily N-acetyltransferase